MKKQSLRRRGQSLGGATQTTVAAPSASESRKHMKVISVSRAGLPTANQNSIFSIGPMQHRSQLSHIRDYSNSNDQENFENSMSGSGREPKLASEMRNNRGANA